MNPAVCVDDAHPYLWLEITLELLTLFMNHFV